MRVVCSVVALALSAVLVSNLSAADQPRRGEGRGQRGQFNVIDMLVRGLELTDAQKEKVEALKKELEPKQREASEKRRGILTDDQRKAQEEAMRAAREAGKDFQEMREAGEKAAKLTDEQKKKLEEAQKAMEAIQKEAREKLETILTAEQKEQLKKRMEEFRSRKPRPQQ